MTAPAPEGPDSRTRARGSPLARWLTTVATLVVAGVFIDTLVRRARRQAHEAAESAGTMTTVARIAHDLSRHSDSSGARAALCAAAGEVTGAASVVLWEPAAEGPRAPRRQRAVHRDARPRPV